MKNRHRVSQVVGKAYLLTTLWLSITDVYVGTVDCREHRQAAKFSDDALSCAVTFRRTVNAPLPAETVAHYK